MPGRVDAPGALTRARAGLSVGRGMAARKTPSRKAKGGQSKTTKRASPRKATPAAAAAEEADRAEKRAKVLEELRRVPLFTRAAALAGMSSGLLRKWRAADPEFETECQAARWKAMESALEQLEERDAAASAAAARWLEKVAPREFRDPCFVDDDLGSKIRPSRVEIRVVPDAPREG